MQIRVKSLNRPSEIAIQETADKLAEVLGGMALEEDDAV